MNKIDVINPFNQQVVQQITLDEADVILQKIDRCALRFQKPLSVAKRKAGLQKWAKLIEQQKPLLAGLITQEQGKPISEALGEVDYALSYIHYYQALIDDCFFEPKHTSEGVFESFRAYGVCAFITPWNFPIAMLIRKVAPAIAAGNTVIAKPSELTPLSAKAIHALFEQAFSTEGEDEQKGLFELCVCDAKLFSQLIMQDFRVRKISFTGSTRVGRLLIEQSAFDIKRLSLELGGDAPCVILPSANLEQAVEGVMDAKFRNAGQTCVAINHLYVHHSIENEFLTRLSEKIKTLTCGDGLDPNTQIGPVIHQDALNQRNEWVTLALKNGAQIISVGQNSFPSVCMTPMLIKNVSANDQLNQQELFAPILVATAFNELDALIELINQSKMGLAGYVFGEDQSQIQKCEQKISVGMLGINTGKISNAKAPFGGVKHSGFGREGALCGIEEFMTIHYSARNK